MEKDNLPIESLAVDQLKKYAADLAEVYKSEKQKRKELEAANKELRETRDMLIQSEKLAAIGRLTAGVAHEILNPVNIISMRLQLLSTTEELSDRVKKTHSICEEQLDRIIQISKDLGEFSRVHEKDIAMCDLNEVIVHVLTLIAPQLRKEGVETDVKYHPDLPVVPLYKARIEQVFLNIFSNAASAMAGREVKKLRIETVPGASSDHARVIISDSGTGIASDDLNSIFEPFFTTKKPGQGTGLGLYISYNIIKEHGAEIWAENNEWGGASFFIEFPVAGIMES